MDGYRTSQILFLHLLFSLVYFGTKIMPSLQKPSGETTTVPTRKGFGHRFHQLSIKTTRMAVMCGAKAVA